MPAPSDRRSRGPDGLSTPRPRTKRACRVPPAPATRPAAGTAGSSPLAVRARRGSILELAAGREQPVGPEEGRDRKRGRHAEREPNAHVTRTEEARANRDQARHDELPVREAVDVADAPAQRQAEDEDEQRRGD